MSTFSLIVSLFLVGISCILNVIYILKNKKLQVDLKYERNQVVLMSSDLNEVYEYIHCNPNVGKATKSLQQTIEKLNMEVGENNESNSRIQY